MLGFSCKWVYTNMNIFNSGLIKVYASKWMEKKVEPFSQEDIALVANAEITQSQYGMSVCFFMKAGGQSYIPLDDNSTAAVGDKVDLTKASLVTLEKSGEKDIFRVRL